MSKLKSRKAALIAVFISVIIWLPNATPHATATEPSIRQGTGLYSVCQSEKPLYVGACLGYLNGFTDAQYPVLFSGAEKAVSRMQPQDVSVAQTEIDQAKVEMALGLFAYCLPESVNAVQIKDLFISYMNEAPKIWHLESGCLMSAMLERYFPC